MRILIFIRNIVWSACAVAFVVLIVSNLTHEPTPLLADDIKLSDTTPEIYTYEEAESVFELYAYEKPYIYLSNVTNGCPLFYFNHDTNELTILRENIKSIKWPKGKIVIGFK